MREAWASFVTVFKISLSDFTLLHVKSPRLVEAQIFLFVFFLVGQYLLVD